MRAGRPSEASQESDASAPAVELSIVIPVFNEEGNLAILHREVTEALRAFGRSYEVLFVDDGSKDRSFPILKSIYDSDPRVRVIRLRRNFGQTAALAAGFDHARGSLVVTLDGDRQNDPADIPAMVRRLEEGFDMVCGWRKRRHDPLLSRRLPSQIANRLISFITGVHLHDYGCTLKVMRSEVVQNLHLYGSMHRFIPAIASWMGVNLAEMVVSHRPREHGASNYGLSRTLWVLLDLLAVKFLLKYSSRPTKVFGLLGFVIGGIGFAMGAWLAWLKYGLVMLASLLMLGGLQLVSLGLLGELLARLFHETRSQRTYAIREALSHDD
jgi:glycosyltransferase involved in cell wall biosynthesis